jgi:hypothetical protein
MTNEEIIEAVRSSSSFNEALRHIMLEDIDDPTTKGLVREYKSSFVALYEYLKYNTN